MRLLSALIVSLLLLSGCSSRVPAKPAPTTHSVSDKRLQKLYAQFERWRGTPNRYGGLSKSGVDCSGLVFLTFKEHFDMILPRDTAGQSNYGKSIGKSKLQSGDLVLFKTGRKIRHVGIYLEKGRFMHSSSKVGVTISSLKSPYWRKHYWQSRRILN